MNTRTHHVALVLAALAVTVTLGGCRLSATEAETADEQPVVSQATVIGLTDGDTFRVRIKDGSEERVRLIGIDTPEIGERLEPFGQEAAEYTARAAPRGADVWLETDVEVRDRYGRLLAYVWLTHPANGDEAEVRDQMLNARIVAAGYANAYTYAPNVKYQDTLAACQAEARDSRVGLWAE